MSGSWILFIVLLVVWLYALSIFKREKQTAFYWIAGSGGFFGFTFFAFKVQLSYICTKIVECLLWTISQAFPMYEVYSKYNIIFINHGDAAISLFIDYECCGIIEMIVVLAIVLFYPLFNKREKAIYSVVGVLYTFFTNIIRLLVVIFTVYYYGNNAFYLAHSIVGRLVFYVFTILLFFFMLTRTQIKRQRVGAFEYENNKNEE